MQVLAVLLIRLMGVFYLVSWLAAVPDILAQLSLSDPDVERSASGWWMALYPTVIALLVIVLAHPLASLVVPKRAGELPASDGLTPPALMQVGTALIGVLIVGTQVHQFVGLVLLGAFSGSELFSPRVLPWAVGPVVGIALIACARFAPKLLEWPTQRVSARTDHAAGSSE